MHQDQIKDWKERARDNFCEDGGILRVKATGNFADFDEILPFIEEVREEAKRENKGEKMVFAPGTRVEFGDGMIMQNTTDDRFIEVELPAQYNMPPLEIKECNVFKS